MRHTAVEERSQAINGTRRDPYSRVVVPYYTATARSPTLNGRARGMERELDHESTGGLGLRSELVIGGGEVYRSGGWPKISLRDGRK